MKRKSFILVLCIILTVGNIVSAGAQEVPSKLYIDGVRATEEQRNAYKKTRSARNGIQPYWMFTSMTTQGLFIESDGTAVCSINCTGYQEDVIKISARIILEKKQPLNTYQTVTYWDRSTNFFQLLFEGEYKVPSSGIYRVKAQYTVYHTPGVYETIEGYSDTWYFNY